MLATVRVNILSEDFRSYTVRVKPDPRAAGFLAWLAPAARRVEKREGLPIMGGVTPDGSAYRVTLGRPVYEAGQVAGLLPAGDVLLALVTP